MPNISDTLREQATQRAHHLCEYCHARQVILIKLEVDHIIPVSAGGTTILDNLYLACRHCNGFKQSRQSAISPDSGAMPPLFNPRADRWRDHFQWDSDGIRLISLTPTGRATISLLRMNREEILSSRRIWAENGWHPPLEDIQ
jgi:hypothetical protein